MVPLETSTIRFLDNFSTGSRGALSAEHFLRNGYIVLFLYRSHTLRPFHRHCFSLQLDDLVATASTLTGKM